MTNEIEPEEKPIIKPDYSFPEINFRRDKVSGPAKFALACLFLLCFLFGGGLGLMYMEHQFFEITGHGSQWVTKKKDICEKNIPRSEECVLTIDFKPASIADNSN